MRGINSAVAQLQRIAHGIGSDLVLQAEGVTPNFGMLMFLVLGGKVAGWGTAVCSPVSAGICKPQV